METTTHSPDALRLENQMLHQRLDLQEAELNLKEAELTLYRDNLSRLEDELRQLKRLIFGTRSERFIPVTGPGQLPLFDLAERQQEPPDTPATHTRTTTTTRRTRRKPARQELPAHLPREVIVIEPEEDTTGLRMIGQEISESLDYRAAKLVVIRRIRNKYADPKSEERGVIIGALPARVIEKGMAEPSLLAHVVIEKYVDHLPLYRQLQRFQRVGITLASSTLGGWITTTADLLVPLYEALKEAALQSGYLQADETTIRVLDADKEQATHRGYYWVYHAPLQGIVVLDYQRGRSGEAPKAFLAGYRGALQSDGYAVYDSYDGREGVTGYNCWAHARRTFFDAQSHAPDQVAHVLKEIGLLYEIEHRLREEKATWDERSRIRQAEAVPILSGLKDYLLSHGGLPKSSWGQAVGYSLGRWDKLTRYVDDGRIEIDNNLIENAIRPIALGRKNYLFAGSHEAAQRAAVIYSLLATCKRHEVNPEHWLTDVLSRIPTHPMKQINDLLPHRWDKGKV